MANWVTVLSCTQCGQPAPEDLALTEFGQVFRLGLWEEDDICLSHQLPPA